MKRVWIGAVAVLMFLAISTVVGLSEPQYGGSLRIALQVEPYTFDPNYYKSMVDLMVDRLMYETLVTFDAEARLIPELATRWERVDNLTWRFWLREDVLFHDGTPFTAEAVKISLERAYESPYGYIDKTLFDSVTIESDYVITINTTAPYPTLLNDLAIAIDAIYSPTAIAQYGDDIKMHPVGTGPFVFDQYVPKQKVVLKANPAYWGGAPYLDEVVFLPIPDPTTRLLAFEAGDVDVVIDPLPQVVEQYEASADYTVVKGPNTRIVWLGFNSGSGLFTDKLLRKAVSYAINYPAIIEYVCEGWVRPAVGPVPPELLTNPIENGFTYDPVLAKEYLAQAGYPEGLKVKIWTGEGRYLRDREIAETIATQLAEIGIEAEVTVWEWGAYWTAIMEHTQEMYMIGAGYANASAYSPLKGLFSTGVPYNHGNYSNATFDALISLAGQTLDSAEHEEVLLAAMRILMTDVALVPIYNKLGIYVMPSKVHDFGMLPVETIRLHRTWIEQ
jgi:peptide/nickel transport system substrate-binding protein